MRDRYCALVTVVALVSGIALIICYVAYSDARERGDRMEEALEQVRKDMQKASDQRVAELTAKCDKEAAKRDGAISEFEKRVWEAHEAEVVAIIKAAKFRKEHPDVPQPKGEEVQVLQDTYLSLFPAEAEALKKSDDRFDEALQYLAILGRVTCEQSGPYHRSIAASCYGSDAVGRRRVEMTR